MDADIANCAALVQRADPDRFRATMAAPVAARSVLFPLYAFNIEVSRAPWVTAEPMIAEMRLQWWRDALGEIAGDGAVRRHEVVTPLAAILSRDTAVILDELVAARSWDIYTDPFSDLAELRRYLDHTAGHLMVAAAQALGAQEVAGLRDFAWATGVANWLSSVPDWRARGRDPLPAKWQILVDEALERLTRGTTGRQAGPVRAAMLAGWQTRGVLTRAQRAPDRVEAGALRPSPARAQIGLMWQAATGRA